MQEFVYCLLQAAVGGGLKVEKVAVAALAGSAARRLAANVGPPRPEAKRAEASPQPPSPSIRTTEMRVRLSASIAMSPSFGPARRGGPPRGGGRLLGYADYRQFEKTNLRNGNLRNNLRNDSLRESVSLINKFEN